MKKGILVFIVFISVMSHAQGAKKAKSEFWKKVQFGGGIALSFTNNASVFGLSPSALYNVNEKFGVGAGISYLRTNYKNRNTSNNAYGGSIVSLYKPMRGVQLSSEFEQTYITYGDLSRDVSALFLGAGYSYGRNITAGLRYDVLYNDKKSLYPSALTPFVRVYF